MILRAFTEILYSTGKKIKILLTVIKKIRTSKTEFLAKIVNGFEPLKIFA